MTRPLVCAALIGLLAAAPPAIAGPYYGSCGQSYAYVQPTYVAPAYSPPTPCSTAYVPPVTYDFFRPGQDIINARLAKEAADAAVDKFKAELASQQQAAAAAAKAQEDQQFKATVMQALQALAQQRAAPVADPRTVQLEADNAKLKETLKRLIESQRTGAGLPPQPPTAGSPQPPPMPPVPRVDAPAVPQPPAANAAVGKSDANVLAAAQQFLTAKCVRCHGDGSAPRLNLTHAERLTYDDLSDCISRIASPVKELAMPKDKPGTVTGDEALPLQLLQATAPRRGK